MNKTDLKLAKFPHIPNIAPQTAVLVEHLRERPDEFATDDELSALCGGDTRPSGKCYTYLHSAIRILRRRYGQVWSRLPGEQRIKRLTATETNAHAESRTRHVRRTANCTVQMLECHDAAAIPEAERAEYLARLAQNKLLVLLGERKATKQLTGVAQPPDLRKLLEAMTG
jgi:hypothetical protein